MVQLSNKIGSKLIGGAILVIASFVFSAPIYAEVSEKEAIDAALVIIPGKVLASKKTKKNKKPAYRVKILSSQGVVKTLFIDASNGEQVK